MEYINKRNVTGFTSGALLGAGITMLLHSQSIREEAFKCEIKGLNEIESNGNYVYLKLLKSYHVDRDSDSTLKTKFGESGDKTINIEAHPAMIKNKMSEEHKEIMVRGRYIGEDQYLRLPIIKNVNGDIMTGYNENDPPTLIDKMPSNYNKKASDLRKQSKRLGFFGSIFSVGGLIGSLMVLNNSY